MGHPALHAVGEKPTLPPHQLQPAGAGPRPRPRRPHCPVPPSCASGPAAGKAPERTACCSGSSHSCTDTRAVSTGHRAQGQHPGAPAGTYSLARSSRCRWRPFCRNCTVGSSVPALGEKGPVSTSCGDTLSHPWPLGTPSLPGLELVPMPQEQPLCPQQVELEVAGCLHGSSQELQNFLHVQLRQ